MSDKSAVAGLPFGGAKALINLIFAALIVTGLYIGREILVPIALAILLSFVLSPFVTRLQHWRVPRVLSVLLVVLVGFSIIFSLGGLMVSQATRLAEDLPSYQQTLRDKIQKVRGVAAGSGTLERASKVLKDLDAELQNPGTSNQPGGRSLAQPSERPIPVEVRQPDPGALTTLAAILGPLVQPTTTTGIVLIFVVFVLLQRQDLRNRFIRLVGSHDIQRTTAALDEAGQRLSKLFLTQIVFNAVFGICIGVGLEIIGVPSAPLWGLIAMIMRFVPYIGAVLSAVFPIILAAAVGAGWEMVLWTVALFAVLELLAGQVLEPLVYGHTSGLSPVAIIVAASFWTWLWGPVGLVLATPLTICLVVIGRHVEQLEFLDVMLGDQPPLSPTQIIYQRMLAGDPMEASEQARSVLKDQTLEQYYDDVVLGGLRLAEADSRLGRLDDERMDRIVGTVREVVDDLEAHDDRPNPEGEVKSESVLAKLDNPQTFDRTHEVADRFKAARSVLCIPGATKLDEAAALILAQALRRRGIGATAESADALSISKFFALDLTGVSLICICYVNSPSNAKVQYAVRRVSRKSKGVQVVIALLGDATAENPVGIVSNASVVHGGFGPIASSILEAADSEGSRPLAVRSAG